MDMRTFLNSIGPQEREIVADKCGTTVDYFWQIAGGHRKPSALLARKIEQHSGRLVLAVELRPDIFGDLDKSENAA